ncbi:MAG: MATE family efflux transporter [Bacteroidales bacterium]|nr:MATE family efflux transporter [Bacteroidales bacterium]
MEQVKDNYLFLTTAPIPKIIQSLATPAIVSMLMTSFYNMADTYFVGKINTQATAAVGVTFALMSVIQAIGFFFGQGSGTYISRQLGARNTDKAKEMASTSFFIALAFGIILTVVGLICLRPLSIALGSTDTILPYTEKFMSMILLGAPFMIGTMTLNNQMKFQGNALLSMYGMLSGAIVNLLCVPLFIFVFDWGIFGAGLGTLIGQISGFIVLWFMAQRKDNIHISLRLVRLKKEYFTEIFRGGTPSLTRQGLAAVSTSLLNLAAGAYGDAAIAGMSIVSRMSFLILSAVIGLGHGFQPLCGFNYGAKLYRRVKEGYFYCIKLSVIFLIVGVAVCFPLSSQIIHLFRDDIQVEQVGAVAFRWQMITYPLVAFITLSNMMMQTTGKSISANLVAASRNGICFIPLIFTCSHFLGLHGIEICQAVSDCLTFIITLPLTIHLLREMKTTEE